MAEREVEATLNARVLADLICDLARRAVTPRLNSRENHVVARPLHTTVVNFERNVGFRLFDLEGMIGNEAVARRLQSDQLGSVDFSLHATDAIVSQ